MQPMYYIGQQVAYLTAVDRGQRNFQVRETSSCIERGDEEEGI